ncbi:nucleic acid/nucleotide deaminase domain-containing protein [Streptomyces profundus]|uniref:nucleic acid/nucleotide deaminase domain-containing protein n=1 Tax=Streptomyces profundus TaxID=2867410 RepID=UPI001D16D89E|nr:nucleic acid/nucleotide deaminase domain-containing protein [Streptomyces sp. MA3_2.13]UED87375.1 SUKH-4 family immunity protein [Streptomyces sp. MA3_2.13]
MSGGSAESEDLRRRLVSRFGPSGLRRITAPDASLPAADAALLAECGVPRQVGPYFTAAGDDSPAQLGAYAQAVGARVPEGPQASWTRVGGDRGAQICVDASGTVRAEFVGIQEPGLLVNVSVTAFLESLLALDEGISSLAATRSVPERAELIRALARRIAVADLEPMESPDSWWLTVLQDVRHTMTHSGYASFEIIDAQGKKQIATSSGALCLHPEERLWEELAESGVRPEQVKEVYTELEACFLPGHYCALWLAGTFPEARFTHSFDYGDTAEEREAGFLALLRETAAQQQGDS